jgi:hypothetical protein
MAELATPAVWLLAKNTHRVFYQRSPLPSGHINRTAKIEKKSFNRKERKD